ncbi:radical SAM protein [Candidatus Fermentibacteria bacterium]|nr:radical SAM protein [Candidatus Fermentibacteria bacterium]
METAALEWVDGFIDSIRPYVHVRLTDNVLIRMPNQAFRLNRTGARTLHHLLAGGSIADIIRHDGDGNVSRDLAVFFTDLSRVLSDELSDEHWSPAIRRSPFALGYIELPILSEISLTFRCNLRCQFCYAACRHVSEPAPKAEMDTKTVKDVLRIIRQDAEVPSVSFTGGEPMLRPDLPDLVAYARSLDMRVNLITNGTLIDRAVAATLKKRGLASAQVSIESPEPAIHDRIVGQGGAHAASVAGLHALQEAGVHVHPHTTLCAMNLDTATLLPAFARSLGATRCSANLVIPAGRGIDPELATTYREAAALLPEIVAAARSESIHFMWYSPIPVCLFNPVQQGLGNKSCAACEGLLSIDPSGQVLPCSSWPEPLGSILEDGFSRIWFGPRTRHIREKREAHPLCRPCPEFALCQGACPLYFHAHDYDEIEPAIAAVGRNVS